MNQLFFGMLLVLVDIWVDVLGSSVEILPDFVGFLLMMQGMKVLAPQSRHFAAGKGWAMVMAVYSALLFAMRLQTLSVELRMILWLLQIVEIAVTLVILRRVAKGVMEIQNMRRWNLQAKKLKDLWLIVAVLQGIGHMCGWIPLVGSIAGIGVLVINICFLMAFYYTKTQYEQHGEQ